MRNSECIELFEKYKVFSKQEVIARYHIWVHTYCLLLEIEANTLNEMVNASVVPAGLEYQTMLADNVASIVGLKKAGVKVDAKAFEDLKGKKSGQSLTSNLGDLAKSYGAELV